ncbi:serine/threonine-protein kinase/endoribonuclease IRE1a-like [Rutidosis leptorrhynchoides]|uniref:serine/threonine-protein kinase/endoribonuclease IRE1a-like n=1 Tax=Rutidosis leptorrhynchoides TaxID=125765 RepID=UPI003A99DAA3
MTHHFVVFLLLLLSLLYFKLNLRLHNWGNAKVKQPPARPNLFSGPQDVRKPSYNTVTVPTERRIPNILILLFVIVIGVVTYHLVLKAEQFYELNAKSSSSRRKSKSKSVKIDGNKEGKAEVVTEKRSILSFNHLTEGEMKGRKIGKLFVSSNEIAKGSNGTVVLEGVYEGRKVAVKRLVRAHHDVALKEINNLIASDRHSNIVRWYGVEHDDDFVYLSLERCNCSLFDLIKIHESCRTDAQVAKAMADYKLSLDLIDGLWKPDGRPSPIMLKLLRDVVSGLVHLHELGIIHRDLKPNNVLIVQEKSLCAKLSDMGISRRLDGDMTSLGHHATGSGSSGWQAPEQILDKRQTRAVDMFSLGCVLFFCITCGKHPFGERPHERDFRVTKNNVDIRLVENIPEAVDLITRLLNPNSDDRPTASEVLHHPLFWDAETRTSFLKEASDRVNLEYRVVNSVILKSLETTAPIVLGGRWDKKFDCAIINNLVSHRRYNYRKVGDLLRAVRNIVNHHKELPNSIQGLLGTLPEGVDDYFASRFPKFLMEVYKVMYSNCKEEEWFRKYLKT